jgi:hypothetical protein
MSAYHSLIFVMLAIHRTSGFHSFMFVLIASYTIIYPHFLGANLTPHVLANLTFILFEYSLLAVIIESRYGICLLNFFQVLHSPSSPILTYPYPHVSVSQISDLPFVFSLAVPIVLPWCYTAKSYIVCISQV